MFGIYSQHSYGSETSYLNDILQIYRFVGIDIVEEIKLNFRINKFRINKNYFKKLTMPIGKQLWVAEVGIRMTRFAPSLHSAIGI